MFDQECLVRNNVDKIPILTTLKMQGRRLGLAMENTGISHEY